MNVAICDDNINYGKLAENYIREIVDQDALLISIYFSLDKVA